MKTLNKSYKGVGLDKYYIFVYIVLCDRQG